MYPFWRWAGLVAGSVALGAGWAWWMQAGDEPATTSTPTRPSTLQPRAAPVLAASPPAPRPTAARPAASAASPVASAATSDAPWQPDPAEYALVVQQALGSQDTNVVIRAIFIIWSCAQQARSDVLTALMPVPPQQAWAASMRETVELLEANESQRRRCQALDEHSRGQWPGLMARALKDGERGTAALLFSMAEDLPSSYQQGIPALPFAAAMVAAGVPTLRRDAQACDEFSLSLAGHLSRRHPDLLGADEQAAYRMVLRELRPPRIEDLIFEEWLKSRGMKLSPEPPPVENPAAVEALAAAIRARC